MSAHRRASRLAGIVMPASRGTSSKSPRFIRHWRRFGDFPAEGNGPYGRLLAIIPFLCGRAHGPCPTGHSTGIHSRRAGPMCPAAITGDSCPPSCQPAGWHCYARQPGHFLEIASLHPPLAALRRFLPTVVPADWLALSCPPAGALPRNRLASSATGGASAISPLRAASPTWLSLWGSQGSTGERRFRRSPA